MKTRHTVPADMTFDDIKRGQEASFTHTVTQKDVDLFTELTGDRHPLHHDEEYARRTQFGGKIVQGLLTASFLSRLIGIYLPGERALYLSQHVKFIKPVRTGDRLTVTGKVIDKKATKRNKITLKTEITNQNGILVLSGHAVVMIREE